jgi:hypothetical protein
MQYNVVDPDENDDSYDADEKDETMLTGTAGKKIKILYRLSDMCKSWGRIRIWINIKTESRIRISI